MVNPFIETSISTHFVDGVGITLKPNTEMYYADWHDDNFVVSRTNSLGFLDREPVSAERAAAGCHIAFIGDSYVAAHEVPIADKFHVRLEEMAARQLPHLGIATQAYGVRGTGQIQQLPLYDEYARRLNPKLLIIVFFINDFANNSLVLHDLGTGADPDRLPYMSAQRDESGAIRLRPPDPEYKRFRSSSGRPGWHDRAWRRLGRISYFAKWLDMKRYALRDRVNTIRARMETPVGSEPQDAAWVDMIADYSCCTALSEDRMPAGWKLYFAFAEERLPPVLEEELEYTAFGIEQFKQRADRDGVNMAILSASDDMGRPGDPQFDRLNAIAQARGIPVISDYDYILRQGYDEYDAFLHYDGHWNATGHQWAAEAVLEWLKANQDVCD